MSSARLCRTIDRIRGFLWLSGGPPVSEREGSVIHRPATLEGLRHAFRQVIDLMRRDPLIPPSLQAMAAIAFMSSHHFLRVFEGTTSVSPARFLTALWMQEAKRLLLETPLSVTAICLEIGYNSLGTYTTLLTDFAGVNPNAFRKLCERLAGHSIDGLIARFLQRPSPMKSRRTISGSVGGPNDFHGVVFLACFPQRHLLGDQSTAACFSTRGGSNCRWSEVSHDV